MNRTHASIDIGSNTLRLLIARPASSATNPEPWEIIEQTHRITRLGESLKQSGKLSDDAMKRTLEALQTFRSIIDRHKVPCRHIYATATAAVREAVNGVLFQQRVLQESGINISIIDGAQEASLSLFGASCVLHPKTRRDMLLFDIGGGSTEFVRVNNSAITDAVSRRLGVVSLTETCLHNDPPSFTDYQAMKESASTHLKRVEQVWKGKENGESIDLPALLVGTAGTVTTLAAVQMNLLPYDPAQINNHQISQQTFNKLRDQLLSLNHEQRQAIPAIEEGRADLIIGGLAIIEAMMERWGYDSFITVDAGLLEGNWLASYDDGSK